MLTNIVSQDEKQISSVAQLLRNAGVPPEQESAHQSFRSTLESEELANAYLAIVAICHQTSPLGERRLQGVVNGIPRQGWDYLKERFLVAAESDRSWTAPSRWAELTPLELSSLYSDPDHGQTLNRVNERAYLLNNLGQVMRQEGADQIRASFDSCGSVLAGDAGFLAYLARCEAYRDPVMKKSLFFTSIAVSECGWRCVDPENLRSPVDYHELRGHLRIGTVTVKDQALHRKVERGLVLSEHEDISLRMAVQEVNDRLAVQLGLTSSIVHYLMWNIFRSCCPRDSRATHCYTCGPDCDLAPQYKQMTVYYDRCVFSSACRSAHRDGKVADPPYLGHFY